MPHLTFTFHTLPDVFFLSRVFFSFSSFLKCIVFSFCIEVALHVSLRLSVIKCNKEKVAAFRSCSSNNSADGQHRSTGC